MYTINKLTALTLALKNLEEVYEIPFYRLMPWKLLWRSSQFSESYKETRFEFEDDAQLSKIIQAASVDREFLKKEFGEDGEGCVEVVIHYVTILEGILFDIVQMKKREKLIRLCRENNTEQEDRVEAEYPIPKYLECTRWYSKNWGSTQESFVAVGTCLETRWMVNWLLMSIGMIAVERFVDYVWPEENTLYHTVLPSLDSWLAWEPFFLVHQIKAEIFHKYFWSVDPEDPSLLTVVENGRKFLDMESDDENFGDLFLSTYGKDLHIFTTDNRYPIGTMMILFKEWGYTTDDIWEFFRPDTGFLSRVFQPSAQGKREWGDAASDEDEIADQMFRDVYIPNLFKKLIGIPTMEQPAQTKRRKRKQS